MCVCEFGWWGPVLLGIGKAYSTCVCVCEFGWWGPVLLGIGKAYTCVNKKYGCDWFFQILGGYFMSDLAAGFRRARLCSYV